MVEKQQAWYRPGNTGKRQADRPTLLCSLPKVFFGEGASVSNFCKCLKVAKG